GRVERAERVAQVPLELLLDVAPRVQPALEERDEGGAERVEERAAPLAREGARVERGVDPERREPALPERASAPEGVRRRPAGGGGAGGGGGGGGRAGGEPTADATGPRGAAPGTAAPGPMPRGDRRGAPRGPRAPGARP